MSTPVHVHPVATTLRICRRRAPCCGTVAARRRRLLDRYLSLPERQQQQTRRTPLLQSIGDTGGQTDGRTLDRLIDSACSAYHACSDNTYKRRIPYLFTDNVHTARIYAVRSAVIQCGNNIMHRRKTLDLLSSSRISYFCQKTIIFNMRLYH